MALVRRLRDPKRKSDTNPNLLTMQLETRKTEPGRNFFGEKLLCSCGETESIPKNIYTRSQLEASVANKEGFFVKRMAENDSRPEGLPPSQGGKYVGCGSSPAPSFQRSNSLNYYFSVVSQNSELKKRKMNSMVSGTLSSFNDIKPLSSDSNTSLKEDVVMCFIKTPRQVAEDNNNQIERHDRIFSWRVSGVNSARF